jgi:hypothetical protein
MASSYSILRSVFVCGICGDFATALLREGEETPEKPSRQHHILTLLKVFIKKIEIQDNLHSSRALLILFAYSHAIGGPRAPVTSFF